MELAEYRLVVFLGNSDPGIPDLNPEPAFVPAAAKQHLATFGVLQCVTKEIADHLLEQARITVYRRRTGDDAKFNIVSLRMIR